MISILACSWPLLPSFVPLHLSPFVISILACSWLLLPSFGPSWSPFWPALGCSCLHLSPFVCLPAWSPFWPALGRSCLHLSPFICPRSWSPLWPALGCSCLHLSPFLCFHAWSRFWAALGCSCLHASPFMISILACSWLVLPSFVSLCDFHSGLLLAAPAFICLPSLVSLHDLWPALGCPCRPVGCRCCLASLHLSPFMISILGCSWLPLPPCLPSFVSLRDLHSGLLLAAPAFICLPSLAPAFICPSLFVSLRDLHSGLLLAALAFICLPSFVSLRDLHSGLLLADLAFICLPPFVPLRLGWCKYHWDQADCGISFKHYPAPASGSWFTRQHQARSNPLAETLVKFLKEWSYVLRQAELVWRWGWLMMEYFALSMPMYRHFSEDPHPTAWENFGSAMPAMQADSPATRHTFPGTDLWGVCILEGWMGLVSGASMNFWVRSLIGPNRPMWTKLGLRVCRQKGVCKNVTGEATACLPLCNCRLRKRELSRCSSLLNPGTAIRVCTYALLKPLLLGVHIDKFVPAAQGAADHHTWPIDIPGTVELPFWNSDTGIAIHVREYKPLALILHCGQDGAEHFQAGLYTTSGWYLTDNGRVAVPSEALLEERNQDIVFVWMIRADVTVKPILAQPEWGKDLLVHRVKQMIDQNDAKSILRDSRLLRFLQTSCGACGCSGSSRVQAVTAPEGLAKRSMCTHSSSNSLVKQVCMPQYVCQSLTNTCNWYDFCFPSLAARVGGVPRHP